MLSLDRRDRVAAQRQTNGRIGRSGELDQDLGQLRGIAQRTIGCQEAANRTNISTSALAPLRRAGVLKTVANDRGSRLAPVFDRSEIVAVDADIRRRWDLSRASLVTGLPYYALEQLCALDRIEQLRRPILGARFREPQITEAAVTAFCDTLRQAAWSKVGDSVPIL